MHKSFTFEGQLSGDGGAFCWLVDRETFIRLVGEEPTSHRLMARAGKFYLYPEMIFEKLPDHDGRSVDQPATWQFTLTVESVPPKERG